MNIEATTVKSTTQTADISTSASSTNTAVKDDKKSFKDELATIKTQDAQIIETKETELMKITEADNEITKIMKSTQTINPQQITTPTATATTAAATTATIEKNNVKNNLVQENSKLIKTELTSAKTQDTQTPQVKEIKAAESNELTAEIAYQSTDLARDTNIQQTILDKNMMKNNTTTQKTDKDTTTDKTTITTSTSKTIEDPVSELSSKIAALNEVKNGSSTSKTEKTGLKTDETSDKSDYCKTMKMDDKDITFFVNLVGNQEMSAQANQKISQTDPGFTDIKTKETQAPVQVSATLMDAINESVKTNKPFRIDFDNNIAVIMKVDKNGTLSANFIPGDAAVENYLRNNIPNLRQSFDNQNLPYSNLSYSNQQKQQQQQQKQNKNKENADV